MIWALSHALGPWAHHSSPPGVVVHIDQMESLKGICNQVLFPVAFIFKVVNIWNGEV